MLKKLIIALLVCGVFWGLRQQLNHMPARSKLTNILKTKINNQKIKSSAASGMIFIPHENMQPNVVVSGGVEHEIIQTNAIMSKTASINFIGNDSKLSRITVNEYRSNTNTWQRKKLSSPDAVWNGRKFLLTRIAGNQSKIAQNKILSAAVNNNKDYANNSKKPSQPENNNDTPIEPNKVHCPLVEKIQYAAQQINYDFFYEGTYRIISYEPAFQDSNMDWLVGVNNIVAGSSDEAIYIARIALSKTNFYKNQFAEKSDEKTFNTGGLFTFFACYYGPSDIIAIGIWDKASVEE